MTLAVSRAHSVAASWPEEMSEIEADDQTVQEIAKGLGFGGNGHAALDTTAKAAIRFVLLAPESYRNVAISCCIGHPNIYLLGDGRLSLSVKNDDRIGSWLHEILARGDPDHWPCLEKLYQVQLHREEMLKLWCIAEWGLNAATWVILKKLEPFQLPSHWAKRKLKEIFSTFSSDEITDDALSLVKTCQSVFEFNMRLRTGCMYDRAEVERKIPIRNCTPLWGRFVARRDEIGEIYGDQIVYGAFFCQTVMAASAFITEKNWGFNELLAFLMMRRNAIASHQKQDQFIYVGFPCPPACSINTKCDVLYRGLGRALIVLLSKPENWGDFVEREGGEGSSIRCQLKAPLGGRVFKHSVVVVEEGQPVVVQHTKDPKVRREIFLEVEKLYNEAASMDDGPQFIRHLGLIFWWLCQAKPWWLGDPSIAEMLIKSLSLSKGKMLPPWKKGLIPWEEVMKCFDPNQFAEKFQTLFE